MKSSWMAGRRNLFEFHRVRAWGDLLQAGIILSVLLVATACSGTISAPPTVAPANTVPPTNTAAPAPTATAPAKVEKVKLRGATALNATSVSWAPYYSVGAYLGWLQDEGLDVAIDNVDTATALTLVTKGDLEFFIGAPEALLTVEGKGTKTGIKFAYDYYNRPWFWLATRADSPLKTIADLKGKTIGLSTLGPPQTPAVELYLRTAGLTLNDITQVAVGNQVSAAQMLQSGQIDAMMQIATYYAGFENAGFKYLYYPKPKEFDTLFGASYYVHERTLTNPALKDAFGRYLRIVAKSVLFAKTNPEATIRMHWKIKPESKPTGIPEDQALANAKRELQVAIDHAGAKPATGRWGELTLDQMRAYIAFANLSDRITRPEDLVTNAFIDAANNFKDEDIIKLAKDYTFK